MGVVWRARDLTLDRDVAIKLLPEPFAADPERRARFEREAKAVAALQHLNIVTIFSVEEAEGLCFFTMELLDGEPLSTHIVPGGVPLDRFLDLAISMTSAIAAAHERGIIHRDLKPGNVMVCSGGLVKILDFGLARLMDPAPPIGDRESATTASIDQAGLTGTIRYMSPEQLRGEPLDHRADLFALGVVRTCCSRRGSAGAVVAGATCIAAKGRRPLGPPPGNSVSWTFDADPAAPD